MLSALDDPRAQSSMNAYNAASAALVGGAQRRSAQLAIAYVVVGRPVVQTPSLKRALASVLVSRESPVTRSPMLRLWRELDAGIVPSLAIATAAQYASALASTDLQVAERGGLAEGAEATGERIVGWRKELSGDPCPWCEEVADEVFRSADAVPFHANDQCAVAPVFEGEE